MRLLADAHISRLLCGFLEATGHDCAQAGSLSPGMSDEDLLRLAVAEKRVILTADKDFGELVFRGLLIVPGVILLRLRAPSEAERLALFQRHWSVIERCVSGYFVVVTNRSVRRTPLPTPGSGA